MTTHHTFRRLAPACIFLVAAGAAGAACGSADANGTLTEAQYRDKANAVCAAAEADLAPIFEAIFPKLATATEAERGTAADGLLQVLGKEIDDLAALTPPDSIADDVDAMLAAVRTAQSTVREQGAGFWLDDVDPFTDADQRAAALGLDACAGDTSE
jgi:hypothetical protein